MEPRLLVKYGTPKLARYFVKSLEDVLDVIETVYKHISQQVEAKDLVEILKCVECTAVPIPRTLSSHILCFSIPNIVLSADNRPANIINKQLELKPGAAANPRIVHEPGKTMLIKEISSFYDMVVFQRFFKSLMSQNSDGIRMFATKRSAELKAESLSEKPGYLLTVSFHGTFFTGQALSIF
jgi:hypothetical protein